MSIRISSKRALGRYVLSIAALQIFAVCGTAQGSTDFGIENDAEYSAFLGAMRAAEYVRSDVIVAENPKPRVYATLAAVMAFAERNPNATDTQLAAFVQAFDTACQAYSPSGPDLNDPVQFYSTLRFLTVDDPIFTGTDTAVGERALHLLGITIPDPDGFESIQRRMVRYEVAMARPLTYRKEIFDLLVRGFYGIDPSGNTRVALPAILNAYFEAEGFDPELGGLRIDRPKVNAGMEVLPANFNEYELAISEGPENTALRAVITAQLDTVRDQITSIVGTDPTIDDGSLDFALANAPGLAESVELSLNNPVYVQSVLDQLRADREATTEARTATSASTYIMLQSEFDEIVTYARYTVDFSSISLQANDDLSSLKSGVTIAGNIGLFAGAVATKDPLTAAGAVLNIITESIGIADDLNDGPSADQQIFNQVVALREQVEQMRQEMHDRFDRIDQQLNSMYETMFVGFDAIGSQIGDLQDQLGDVQSGVEAIIRDMAEARSRLRRLETALYGMAQDILLTDLTSQTNVVLDYRDENGIDLQYSGGSPNFITASESFFTYATITSQSAAFAGSRTNPTVTIDDLDELLDSPPIASYMNDLAVLPQSFGLPELANSDLPGIEPWTQAASAYAQLARENPWYFSYRYGKQLDDYNSDPANESLPELDRITQSGKQLVAFIDAIRATDSNGDSALFDVLIENYTDAAIELKTLIDADIAATIPPAFTNGTTTLNYWQGEPQLSVFDLVGYYNAFEPFNGSNTFPLEYTANVSGFFPFSIPGGDSPEFTLAHIWHLSRLAEFGYEDDTDNDFYPRIRWSTDGGIRKAILWFGNQDQDYNGGPTHKEVEFRAERSVNGVWTTSEDYTSIFSLLWVDNAEFREQFIWDTGIPEPGTYTQGSSRIRILWGTPARGILFDDVWQILYDYRKDLPLMILDQISTTDSEYEQTLLKLDTAEALLDAYVTIGMPNELNQSEVLRSALRARPGTSELGLGFEDILRALVSINDTDSPNDWADQDLNVSILADVLIERIDLVADEIKRGLQLPTKAPGYVGWMLAELEHLRLTAFDLAVDDTYLADLGGIVETSPSDGLLSNDVDQEYSPIFVDTMYDADPLYQAPQNGQITINADGSFFYQADPGFSGTDSFTYRSVTSIPNVPDPVYSNAATVIVIITESTCGPADFTGDGSLDIFDVFAFLDVFNASDPTADFTNDGVLDIFDVFAFLDAFNTGCP